MNKRLKLMDPAVPGSEAGAPTITNQQAAETVITKEGVGFSPPADDQDTFLDDTKPPAVVPPVEAVPATGTKPLETVVIPPVQYTPEQVAELLKRNTPTAPAAPVVVPKQLTPEEIDAQLGTFRASEADVNAILEGGPKAVEALNRMIPAIVKNAVTVATILAREEQAKFQRSVQPHIEFAQQQQQVYAQQRYFVDNPTHVGLEPLVNQVATQMFNEKFKGTPTEIFKEVGKRVNDLVTRLKMSVAQPGVAAVAAPAVSAPARMSTVSTGGQGGAGGTGVTKPADPEAGIWSSQ